MSNLFASYLTPASTAHDAPSPPSSAFSASSSAFLKVDSGATPSTASVGAGGGTSPLMVASPLLAAAAASSVASSGGSSFPSSLSASSTPICIGSTGAGTGGLAAAMTGQPKLGGGLDGTTAGSAASSFSAKLSNLYVGSLPEGLLLPFLCQQQQLQQQQQQQFQPQHNFISNLPKDANSPFGLTAQSIATTVQSILGGNGQSAASSQPSAASTLSTASSSATATPAASAAVGNVPASSVDVDMSEEQLTNQMQCVFRNHLGSGSAGSAAGAAAGNGGTAANLGTSLPSMSIFLNNFISNSVQHKNNNNNNSSNNNNGLQMDTGLSESVIESLKLDQASSFQRSASSSRIIENRSQDNATTSSRTTSESSNAAEESGVVSGSGAGITASVANMTAASAGAPTDANVATSVAAAFAAAAAASAKNSAAGSNALLMGALPTVEHLKHEALPGQRAGERSGSPLKMRSRLNSRNKGIERSTTPPNGQPGADDESSNICNVCGDEASGRHYGASTCFGCKGFFRRTVRANKTYSCRYEERCAIDKLGRNTCRSCRFRKCLTVGMEPDAIRPDRDKTGRQKNPRRQSIALPTNPMTVEAAAAAIRAAASLPSSHDSGALVQQLTDDETTPNAAASGAGTSEAAARLRLSFATDDSLAPEAMVAERDLVIDTLLEIERICANLRDVPQQQQPSSSAADDCRMGDNEHCSCATAADSSIFAGELAQVIARPSLISTRSQLEFTGLRGPIYQTASGAECCGRANFQRAFRRLLTLSIDFANTLKPIADISVQQRENLVRSCIGPYMVFLCAFRTVSSGHSNCILLPDGRYIDAQTPLSAFVDPQGLSAEVADSLHSKIRFICKSVMDSVQSKMEKLSMSEVEFVCLKAIIALDPTAPAINSTVAQLLSVARDSVQNALFYHLMERHSSQQAVFRFGQLLMMIANVTKIGAFLCNALEMVASVKGSEFADSATLRLFIGIDRMSNAFAAHSPPASASAAGGGALPSAHRKDDKMSSDSDDDDDDEMDEMDANE